MEPIILASASPRRQEILKKLGIPFVVNPAEIEEDYPSGMSGVQIPEYLAGRKITAVAHKYPANYEIGWILGADTIVIHRNRIYGKPKTQEEAFKFLSELQGTTHRVITGLALFSGEKHYLSTRTSVNKITFAPMTEKEIAWYVGTGEWHGVAGGYRIQGMASCFIKKIEGSESSIMGLPIFELYDILREQNYNLID